MRLCSVTCFPRQAVSIHVRLSFVHTPLGGKPQAQTIELRHQMLRPVVAGRPLGKERAKGTLRLRIFTEVEHEQKLEDIG